MRIDLRPYLFLFIGRSDYQARDAEIFIGLGWDDEPEAGIIRWRRHTLTISWDWLPRLCWVEDGFDGGWHCASNAYSALWTGRTHRLHSWSWHFAVRWW